MVNRMLHPRAATRDLALQCGDPRLQLGDRQPVQVLAHQLGQQVGGAGEGVVQVHGHQR